MKKSVLNLVMCALTFTILISCFNVMADEVKTNALPTDGSIISLHPVSYNSLELITLKQNSDSAQYNMWNSTDEGNTWTNKDQPWMANLTDYIIYSVNFDPNFGYLMLAQKLDSSPNNYRKFSAIQVDLTGKYLETPLDVKLDSKLDNVENDLLSQIAYTKNGDILISGIENIYLISQGKVKMEFPKNSKWDGFTTLGNILYVDEIIGLVQFDLETGKRIPDLIKMPGIEGGSNEVLSYVTYPLRPLCSSGDSLFFIDTNAIYSINPTTGNYEIKFKSDDLYPGKSDYHPVSIYVVSEQKAFVLWENKNGRLIETYELNVKGM